MPFDYLISSVLLTAFVYMFFPLIKLLVNGKRFHKKRARKIALWNSIIVGILFSIITLSLSEDATTWSPAPAFLYYWINKAILTDKQADEPEEKTRE